MMRFLGEFEIPEAEKTPNGVKQLNSELDKFNRDVTGYHVLFVESILVFALTAMGRPDSDAKIKARNARLIDAQLLRVAQSAQSMDKEAWEVFVEKTSPQFLDFRCCRLRLHS